MSAQETRIEITGNIVVHHPVKEPSQTPHPIIGDGHAHKRDRNGTCGSCGASKYEYHYKLVPVLPTPTLAA